MKQTLVCFRASRISLAVSKNHCRVWKTGILFSTILDNTGLTIGKLTTKRNVSNISILVRLRDNLKNGLLGFDESKTIDRLSTHTGGKTAALQ